MNCRDPVTLAAWEMLALQSKTLETALLCRINQKRHVAQKHFICARKRHDRRVKTFSSSLWTTSGSEGAGTVLNNWVLEGNWGHRSIIPRGLFSLQRYPDTSENYSSMMMNLERKKARKTEEGGGERKRWDLKILQMRPISHPCLSHQRLITNLWMWQVFWLPHISKYQFSVLRNGDLYREADGFPHPDFPEDWQSCHAWASASI